MLSVDESFRYIKEEKSGQEWLIALAVPKLFSSLPFFHIFTGKKSNYVPETEQWGGLIIQVSIDWKETEV